MRVNNIQNGNQFWKYQNTSYHHKIAKGFDKLYTVTLATALHVAAHTHTHIKYLVADTDTSSMRLIVQKQEQLYADLQTYKKEFCVQKLIIIFIIISSICNVPLLLEWEYPVMTSCCFAVSVQLELMNPTIRIIINKIKSIPHMYMPIKVISFMLQF